MNDLWLWFCQWQWARALRLIDRWERRTAAAKRRVLRVVKGRNS